MEVEFVTNGILEGVEVEENNDDSSFDGERCGICMDIIIERGLLDCCQHWFCFGCIDNWSTITNLCPLCQNEFQMITCVPVYDTIGSGKVDEESNSRDDDWSIEEKSNTLSFPSYYIDENAVTCLDGDDCKIRSHLAVADEDSDLDTSIACDSCNKWYHAFCVGFDPDGISEDTWLCPRCAVGEEQQNSDATPVQGLDNHPVLESSRTETSNEATFSGLVSVSVADAGETAIVVSMVGGNKGIEEPSDSVHSTPEGHEELKANRVNPDGDSLKAETPMGEKIDIQIISETQELEHSLTCDKSSDQTPDFSANTELNTCDPDDMKHGPADHLKNEETEDEMPGYVEQQTLSEESLPGNENILLDGNEVPVKIVGIKRKQKDSSDAGYKAADDEETIANNGATVYAKKSRAEGKSQVTAKNQVDALLPDGSQKCPTPNAPVPKDFKSKLSPKEVDLMSIVRGTGRRPSKGPGSESGTDISQEESDNAAGLRVKKIMRRNIEDKETSVLVQKLRKEIREAVRNKSSTDIGENLFDPKLLAAFRSAVAGPTTESTMKIPSSTLKAKKLMLQKGKTRENLTKKIYGDSNGRRRRAWNRDCEVEFWKHRCIRATKPEKVETLKSVLDLLRNNTGSSEIKQASVGHVSNPILSRLYLADTSVFPRKDDIKPLSDLTSTSSSDRNTEQQISVGGLKSVGEHTPKCTETSLVPAKLGVLSVHDTDTKDKVQSSKGKAASSKTYPDRGPEGSPVSLVGGLKVNLQNESGGQSDDRKIDKRKWALEVLARKKAAAGKVAEQQEDNAMLKGNYPLLTQLPIDMRPALAPSRHNKIPVSVRQTQLYRLTEHFLRKLNVQEIRRTAETELAVADAINIEKDVADRSNSKPVYLNLCSQEMLRRLDNSKLSRATESNSLPVSPTSIDRPEQESNELPNDPAVMDALRNAGLLSDSPPNSPNCKTEVTTEASDSVMQIKYEVRDNVFEIDSHQEVDIYGDFEYDLDDEDYAGITSIKVSKPQRQWEEGESRMKVVFSSLKPERSNGSQDYEDCLRLQNIEESKDSPSLPKSYTDSGITSSNMEDENNEPLPPAETMPVVEDEDLSLAECEEIYGPDKESLVNKFPEEASTMLDGRVGNETQATNEVSGKDKSHSSCNGEDSSNHPQRSTKDPRKYKPEPDTNKQSGDANSVYKKVEAYVKEHIRPLYKSSVITAEEYRWAVAKTTDKVMKYHANAKNANFLIKEGEKVKKLAERYVETAQWREKDDHPQ